MEWIWETMCAIGQGIAKVALKHMDVAQVGKKNQKRLDKCVAKCYTLGTDSKCGKIGGGKMARNTAMQIAQWFLAHNNVEAAENGAEFISNLKLQKLLYYAQGTFMGIYGEKLFDDPILAWKHGPIVEAVYHEYKGNGSNGIPFNGDFDTKKYDADTQDVLEAVYANFAQFSAWKLRDMTHEERPWKETNQNYEINPELIKSFFIEKYIEEYIE